MFEYSSLLFRSRNNAQPSCFLTDCRRKRSSSERTQNHQGPFLPSSRHITVIQPAISFKDTKADPVLALPSKLKFRVRWDKHTPVTKSHSSKRLLFGQKQRNPQGPFLLSSWHIAVIQPAVSFKDAIADPAFVLPNKLEFRGRRDTHMPVATSDSSKTLFFGQKQIVYSMFFFVVHTFVVRRPQSPIHGLLYCVLNVLLRSLGAQSGWST